MWQRWVAATKIFEKSSDNGASWTPLGLDASIITQGVFDPARLPAVSLPANVAYKNINNNFSTTQNINGGLVVSNDLNVSSGIIQTYPAPARRIELDTAHLYERHRRTYKLFVNALPIGGTIRFFTQETHYAGHFINICFGFQAGWNKNFVGRIVLDGYGAAGGKLELIAGDATQFAWAIEDTEPGKCSLMLANLTGFQINVQAVVECMSWTANSGITSGYMQY